MAKNIVEISLKNKTYNDKLDVPVASTSYCVSYRPRPHTEIGVDSSEASSEWQNLFREKWSTKTVMSEKADINQENIERALLYNRGLTAEQAVLWAFGFKISLFATITDIKHYLRNKEGYIESASDEGLLDKQQTEYLDNADFYKQQKEKEPQLDMMKKLKKRLLSDIHYQLHHQKHSSLVFSQPEMLHYIWTDNFDEKSDEAYYNTGDDFPGTEEVPIEEQTVSYASLYEWFCLNSIEVKSWKNLKSFQKLPWGELEPLKRRRNSYSGERSALVTYGAIIELLAKSNGNRLIDGGQVNVSQFVKYLKQEYTNRDVSERTLTNHINKAKGIFNEDTEPT